MELTRSTAFCEGTTSVREQMNGITAFIDASNVYGSDDKTARSLRKAQYSDQRILWHYGRNSQVSQQAFCQNIWIFFFVAIVSLERCVFKSNRNNKQFASQTQCPIVTVPYHDFKNINQHYLHCVFSSGPYPRGSSKRWTWTATLGRSCPRWTGLTWRGTWGPQRIRGCLPCTPSSCGSTTESPGLWGTWMRLSRTRSCIRGLEGRTFPILMYRVTHRVEPNLPLTSKQKLRFGLASPDVSPCSASRLFWPYILLQIYYYD